MEMSYEDLHVNQVDRFLEQADAIVIDVRDSYSFNTEHIKGALHIDGPTMGSLIQHRKKNPPVLVYCYHGNSSRDMAEIISHFGFTNVSNLVGGWEAWKNLQMLNKKNAPVFNPQFSAAFA